MVIATFEGSNDAQRKMTAIFTNHIVMSQRIKGDVIEYMAENWAEWERTKPPWFTPGFISKIPDEYIPRRALRALNHASVCGIREKQNRMNLSELARASLGGTWEKVVADAAADAISAEDREVSQRKLSVALRAGHRSREESY